MQELKKLNQVIRGWINYFKIADMKIYMSNISEHLRHRLRCIIWKQWKTPKLQLGLDKNTAKLFSYSGKSYWSTSMCAPIHKVISNNRLRQKGLVFPLVHY